jgi:PAS domain S-box-containing protein
MKDDDRIEKQAKKAGSTTSEGDLLYRSIFNQSPDGILIIDIEGKFVDFNDAAHNQLGYTREEFAQLRLPDIDPFQSPEEIQASIRKVLAQGSDVLDVKHRTKKGEIRDVHVITQLLDLSGRKVFHTIWRDVTEGKRMEEALRASENFLHTVIETAPECVKLLKADGSLLLMNRAGLDMIEARSLDEVKGKSVYPLVATEDREAFQTLVAKGFQGRGGTLEFDMVGVSGKRLRMETYAVPLHNEKQDIIAVLGVTRDVTERKKMEEDLLRAQKLESIGILAGGIAHDFNNLLTAILGNIGLAKAHIDSPDNATARLREAERASLRARDLTYQLLTFARGGTPVKKTASMDEIIHESTRFALRGSKSKCEFSIPADLWPVEIDVGQMSQVVNNLIINADQAMPAGGTIRVRCTNINLQEEDAVPLRPGDYIKIAVEDTGTGIPHDQLSKIFDPYFTTKQTGSGLGLATAYSIIKRHEGHITVESQPGVGSVFHVYVPASKGVPLPGKADEEAAIKGAGRILFMDDEDAVREVVAEMLRSLGYQVESARDGAEVISRYAEAKESGQAFDAVLMDLTVPGGMGGKETIQKLRAIDPCVRAIVASGYSNDDVIADYQKYGFSGVVEKPFTLANVASVVYRVLKSRS